MRIKHQCGIYMPGTQKDHLLMIHHCHYFLGSFKSFSAQLPPTIPPSHNHTMCACVLTHVYGGVCLYSHHCGKRVMEKWGSHSELSRALGTVQMAAASLGCHLPATFCLLMCFDLTHQDRWLGGRGLVRVNIWQHVNNECACGINQPYHFWLVAMARESNVSCVNQSNGIAAHHQYCCLFFSTQGSSKHPCSHSQGHHL